VQITSPGSNVNWFFAKHYTGVMCGGFSHANASGILTIYGKVVQKNIHPGGPPAAAAGSR
jgi:hypothetical protein